jgi:Endoplasmic reticulum vesicle transporter
VYGYDDYHAHEHHDLPDHHHAIGEHHEPLHNELAQQQQQQQQLKPSKARRDITNYLLPGVFFVYDMAPFMLEVTAERLPLHHLLIRLCAIAGGVYAVSGMLDRLLHYSITHMKGRGLLPS